MATDETYDIRQMIIRNYKIVRRLIEQLPDSIVSDDQRSGLMSAVDDGLAATRVGHIEEATIALTDLEKKVSQLSRQIRDK